MDHESFDQARLHAIESLEILARQISGARYKEEIPNIDVVFSEARAAVYNYLNEASWQFRPKVIQGTVTRPATITREPYQSVPTTKEIKEHNA